MDTEQKSTAREFLSAHTTGVLGTLGEDGAPHTRTVYYESDESFGIYFITLANTRKAADIAHDARAAFVVSSEETPRTLQLEGTIQDLTEDAENTEVVQHLLHTLLEKGSRFAPVTRLSTGEIRFYKFTPTWARFGDFSHGQGSDAVLHELPL